MQWKVDWCCRNCVCTTCLMHASGRCPYGTCFDDHRALTHPYDEMHPNEPPRKAWSDWRTQQMYWCRGGAFYPSLSCEHYVRYEGSRVEDCLGAVIQKFQDGFIRCGCGDDFDCNKCYQQFEENRF